MHEERPQNLLHLACRIHGLVAARLPHLNKQLVNLLGGSGGRFRRPKQDQLDTVIQELPVLLLILVFQETERRDKELKAKEADLLKSCLIHFFSIHFVSHYLDRKDPIKEMMTRVDWYMDGDTEPAEQLFSRFVFNIFPERKDTLAKPLAKFISEDVPAELNRALDLAPLYKL